MKKYVFSSILLAGLVCFLFTNVVNATPIDLSDLLNKSSSESISSASSDSSSGQESVESFSSSESTNAQNVVEESSSSTSFSSESSSLDVSSSESVVERSDTSSSSSSSSGPLRSSVSSEKSLEERQKEASIMAKSMIETEKDAAKARVDANNNKGAQELYQLYLKRLKDIKSGKITRQERQALLSSQISTLQTVLSKRLNSLQEEYSRNVSNLENEIAKLSDDHKSDRDAFLLHNKLLYQDTWLAEQESKANLDYTKQVDLLQKQVESKPVKSKKEQRKEAKDSYYASLEAIGAKDPKQLEKENKASLDAVLKKADELVKNVK